jgi:hypothetical protein
MKQNIGGIDRIVRIVVGAVILGAGLYFQNWLGLLGLIPLGTALMGFCPLYVPIGTSTK